MSLPYVLAAEAGAALGRYVRKRRRAQDMDNIVLPKRKKARFSKLKRKYRKKVYKRSKTSKTSNCARICRKIVKQALKQDENTGVYLKNYAGFVKPPPSQPNLLTEQADVGLYWQDVTNQSWVIKKRLDFFTPKYLKDIASVLYNGKTAVLEPSETGDFSKLADLKFTVCTAIATISFRNCTENSISLTLIEATPKELEEEDFGTDWAKSLESTNMTQVGGVTATPFTQFQSPLQIKGLWKRYRMKEKTKILRPGEYMIHTVSMPKNFQFNGVSYYDSNVIAKYAAFSKQVWYKYRSLIQPAVYTSPSSESILAAYRPLIRKDVDAPGLNPLLNGGIVVEVKEKYRISAPKNTDDDKKVDAYCLSNNYDATTQTFIKNFEIAPSYSLTYHGNVPN